MLEPLYGAIASLFVERVNKAVNESDHVALLKNKLRGENLHGSTVALMKRVLFKASNELANITEKEQLKYSFLDNQTNKEVLVELIISPFNTDIGRFELGMALGGREKEALKRFITKLKDVVFDSRLELFSGESLTILSAVALVVSKLEYISKGVDRIENQLGSKFNKIFSRLDQISPGITQEQISHQPSLPTNQSKIAQRILNKVTSLYKNNNFNEARNLANSLLDELDDKNKKDIDTIIELQRTIANCILAAERDQSQALPYLKKVVQLSDDHSIVLRNKALIALLEGNLTKGLSTFENEPHTIYEDAKIARLKANLLLESNRLKELGDFLRSLNLNSDPEISLIESQLALKQGNFDKAILFAEKVISLEPKKVYPHLHITQVIVNHIEPRASYRAFSEEDYSNIHLAQRHIENARKHLPNQPFLEFQVCHYAGIIEHWLRDYPKSMEFFERAYELHPSEPTALRNLISNSALIGDSATAIKYLDEYESIVGKKDDTIYLRAKLNIDSGNTDKAVELLESLTQDKDISLESNIEIYLLLSDAYLSNIEMDKSEFILSRLEQHHPNNVQLILFKIDRYISSNNLNEAISLIRKCSTNIGDREKYILERAYSISLYLRGTRQDLEEAIPLLKKISNESILTRELNYYALALFRMGKLSECYKLCNKVLGKHNNSHLFLELKARIYFQTFNYSKASKYFKILSTFDTNAKLSFILDFSICQYRLGNREKALEAMKIAANNPSNTSNDLINISQVYAGLFILKEAVKYAYEAVLKDNDNPDIWRSYINLFMMYGNLIEKQKAANTEHITTFQNLLSEYETRFPEAKYFEKIEFNEEDPKTFVENIKLLLPSPEIEKTKSEFLKTNNLPIGSIANIMGRDIPSTWHEITTNKELKLTSNIGTLEEFKVELEAVSESKNILVTSVPLMTLARLKLIQLLPKYFEKIYIHQKVIDELMHFLDQERLNKGQVRRSLAAIDEILVFNETPAETADKLLLQVEEVVQFIFSNNVEIIGNSIHRNEEIGNIPKQKVIETIGAEALESILECRERSITLYSDSYLVRNLGASSLNITSFSTQSLLRFFVNRKQISNHEYHESILILLTHNYHFISISLESFIHAVNRRFGLPFKESIAVFRSFHSKENLIEPIVRISMAFLRWLWINQNFSVFNEDYPSLAAQWTFHLLDAIAISPERLKIINELYHHIPLYKNFLASKNELLEIEKVFEFWYKRHTDNH